MSYQKTEQTPAGKATMSLTPNGQFKVVFAGTQPGVFQLHTRWDFYEAVGVFNRIVERANNAHVFVEPFNRATVC
jgi:hypothetical protein